MLEGLNIPDLRFLGILSDLNPEEHLPSAQVENILALPDLNADTPETNPLLYLSADSSGTNVQTRVAGTIGSQLRQRDRRSAWERLRHVQGGRSGEARRTSDAQTAAGNVSGIGNVERDEDESFPQSSSSEAPSDVQRRRQRRHKAAQHGRHPDESEDDGTSGSAGSYEQGDRQHQRYHCRTVHSTSGSGGDEESDTAAEEESLRAGKAQQRRGPRIHSDKGLTARSSASRRKKDRR
jgi:hypothetical protein